MTQVDVRCPACGAALTAPFRFCAACHLDLETSARWGRPVYAPRGANSTLSGPVKLVIGVLATGYTAFLLLSSVVMLFAPAVGSMSATEERAYVLGTVMVFLQAGAWPFGWFCWFEAGPRLLRVATACGVCCVVLGVTVATLPYGGSFSWGASLANLALYAVPGAFLLLTALRAARRGSRSNGKGPYTLPVA